MDIAELQKLSEGYRQNGAALLEKLRHAADLLGAEFLSRLGSQGYYDGSTDVPFSQIIQHDQERVQKKITSAGGGLITVYGELPFTLRIVVPNLTPHLRIYVDLAVRISDGVAQYCMWHSPASIKRRPEKWMAHLPSFADTVEEEIKRFLQHDLTKGDLVDTSVSTGGEGDAMYELIYGEAPPR
ncbi:hypothetical protein RBA41_28230 [Massilia sp. CCM 9210]|uniref:hypothetical protein n=1 Tax=Massilia scottii TaxID=3057166 RepID=UPI002796AB00|nr:hypothetical protein [Massilia sp. CCM 9210]MDQ1817198.1 hypothetical protein [Massilia sp. CCM 9210]